MVAQPTTASRRTATGPMPRRLLAGRRMEYIDCSFARSSRSSVQNEAGLAVIGDLRVSLPGDAVDAIELAEQDARGVAGVGVAVVGPRQFLQRHGVHDIGRDQNHELG